MEPKTIIGIVAGTLTAIASLPQILKTLRTKEASDVSPIMFIVLLTGNGLWAYYGILLKTGQLSLPTFSPF